MYPKIYNFVYSISNQKLPYCWIEKCYDFLEDISLQYALYPGHERDIFISFLSKSFKYVNRFYVQRKNYYHNSNIIEIEPLMIITMDLKLRSRKFYYSHKLC